MASVVWWMWWNVNSLRIWVVFAIFITCVAVEFDDTLSRLSWLEIFDICSKVVVVLNILFVADEVHRRPKVPADIP